ncbi:MAG: YicC family protein [Treponema sp.]|nr:YicC family protein [Treponema sp.]MBR7081077.1 YicC family protein [Treponema sp.]
MNSMTGYGYKEAVVEDTQISVEIRSVNSRFLDLNVNLPSFLNILEKRIRQMIGNQVVRGKVDVTIRVRDLTTNAVISADPKAAVMYRDAFVSVAKALGMEEKDVPLELIIQQEGVLNVSHEYDAESYWHKIQTVFEPVFAQFVEDRKREGENLKVDLLHKLDVLDECAAFFKEWQPKMEERFKEIISKKFHELLDDHVDENKILEETASMLVKYTINEEIIRLHSHLTALRKEMTEDPVPGKRIDFICQEANREINTIGSKNQFTEIGSVVVQAKDALENIREQSKNVE